MLGGRGQHGLLEMAIDDVFHHISQCTTRAFRLRVIFVEVHNEKIRDLLTDDVNSSVEIREDPKKVTLLLFRFLNVPSNAFVVL